MAASTSTTTTSTGGWPPAAPLAGLVAIGLALRLAVLALPFDYSGPDTASYLAPAESLARGEGFRDALGATTAARPPGYPAFLALTFLLAGGPSPAAARVAQALVGALAALAIHALLRPRGRGLALAGAALVALDPLAVGQAPFLLREALLLGLVCLMLAALSLRAPRARYALTGAALAALTLTHSLYAVAGGFLALADAAAARARGRSVARALLPWLAVAALVVLAVLPWARRNERVLGRYSLVLTDNAAPARELYFTTAYSAPWLAGDPSTGQQAALWAEERDLVARLGVDGARDEYYRRAWEAWRTHPLRSLGRTLRLNAWYWLEVPGAVRLAEHPTLFAARWGLLAFHWARLGCALAAVGIVLRRGTWRPYRHALAVLAFLAVVPALLYPVPRYLGPAAPVLDLLAVLGAAGCVERRRAPEAAR